MSVEIIRNSREAADEAPPSPLHEDGTRYPFSMRFDGEKFIAFGDTPAELLGLLISGYEALDSREQQVERIKFATRVQVVTQAMLNAEADPEVLDALTEAESAVINGPRFEQPHGWGEGDEGDVWDSPLPLVLVETGYAPYTDFDKPISGMGDVENPPNMIWLRPIDEWEFLTSLAEAGYIDLYEATDL